VKKTLVTILVVIVLVLALGIAGAAGFIWYRDNHVFVDGDAYEITTQNLDLTGEDISIAYYDELQAKLPDCKILWDVPFQGSTWPNDAAELTVSSLTPDDIQLLEYFPQLQTIDATGCADYALLMQLRSTYPDLRLQYTVPFGGTQWAQDAAVLTASSLSEADAAMLACLPEVTEIDATGCEDYALLMQLRSDHPDIQLRYTVPFGGTQWPQDAAVLTASSLSEADVAMLAYLPDVTEIDAGSCSDLDVLSTIHTHYPAIDLHYQLTACGKTFDRFSRELTLAKADPADLLPLLQHMPDLKTLTLTDPQGDYSDLQALTETYPDVTVTWSRKILGVDITSSTVEADLSGTAPESLEQLRQELVWFPGVETLILCDLPYDNETMAAFREEMRSEYKVVWNVKVGNLILRTDDTYYMPGKYQQYPLNEDLYNLRYCEDMICIDLGHKAVFDCEWAAFMPDLKYLILADTPIDDISPLAGLENLVYLELFLTWVDDLTPLLSCPALEDLNIGFASAALDPEPLTQMTWLKNLWWANCPVSEQRLREALPDTRMMLTPGSSTGNGWRELPNYYAMRDALGEEYM